ncbi:MAG: YdcF family protein [Firmicutes bacterium]|nr:YdcF family protein [Bacillota bacterium]
MKIAGAIFKNILLSAGCLLAAFGILTGIYANVNAANFMLVLAGAVIGSFRFLPDNKYTRIYALAVAAGAAVYAGIACFIALDRPQTADGSEDAVIVLGCAVIGDRPSNTMYARTLAAAAFAAKNPDAVFVLSGGKGPQEDISEAEAMEKLLLDCGIPPQKIIIEDRATSTTQNFTYSKELLDRHFGGENYSAAFVTNDFHCYRAGRLAQLCGFDDIRCIPAKTPRNAVLLCYMREVLAVIKMWIFKC